MLGYAVLVAFVAAALGFSITAGQDAEAAPAIGGTYTTSTPACFGSTFVLDQSGEFVDIDGDGDSKAVLRLDDDRLTGDASCAGGTSGAVDLAVSVANERPRLEGTIAGEPFVAEIPEPSTVAAAIAVKEPRSTEETISRLMLAIAVVILAARLVAAGMAKVRQPRVMGEVLAGILLGPTLLGAVAPDLQHYLFPPDIVPLIAAAAYIGLVFYLFIVGMELDPGLLRKNAAQAALISNASVALPLSLGFLAAIPLYPILAPDADYLPFAMFIGVAMSVTAFPVLARILIEHRMLKTPIGGLALAGAAVDDVTAWALVAVATALAGAASGYVALVIVGATALFAIALYAVGRPLLARMSTAYDEVGRVPTIWLGVIFVSVLLAAYVAGWIGIAPVVGAFLVGMIMPRHAGLTEDVRGRLEDFVVIVLLPLFFVVTGLRTEINALNRWELWLITLGLVAIAIIGKWIGAALAARYGGFSWRESNVVGALMNTRGLTELIVLNIGLNEGLISKQLFTMLVVMALVTTFMAGPALNYLNADGRLSEPLEDTLRAVGLHPERAERPRTIVVAPQDERNTDALLALGTALARSEPARELLLARLLVPSRYPTGTTPDERQLAAATAEVRRRRDSLVESGIDARVAAFTTPDPGADLVRLAEDDAVDLVLLDGSRPLLGTGVPKGEVGKVLADAASDVAVLVDSEGGVPLIDADHPVVVPFGGAEHDWAALELGVWIASARDAPLRLLGAKSSLTNGERDASRLLASASLAVQQLMGVVAEPVLVEPGREVIRAGEGAGLLLVGLSDRWREEGLGELRAELVKAPPAPILLVRRGERPGVLGVREDLTRLRWSIVQPSRHG